MNSDLLAEHLQEIRALRQRLEESIRTNDASGSSWRRDWQRWRRTPAATNIFIHGNEEQGQLANEAHGQVEQSRRECEALRQETSRLQERLELSSQENSQLAAVPALQQGGAAQVSSCKFTKRSRLKIVNTTLNALERSIQTNTALRQRLEEQLLRGPHRSETININYLLSSPDEGGSHNEHTSVLHEEKRGSHSEVEGGSFSSSSGDSAPSRLVPGHRMWANRSGRHILGLIEDYNALRKQISEGRKLSRSMDAHLQESLHTLTQQGSDNKVQQQHLESFSGSVNTMLHVMEEAGRMLKLVWRVALPAGGGGNNQQDELLKNEISRLKSRAVPAGEDAERSGEAPANNQPAQRGDGASHRGSAVPDPRSAEESQGQFRGGPSEWPVGGAAGPHSESSEEHSSDASVHCSY
ncbi:hypothetical protein KUCAC02_009045 [Chaenocephalus aceratus]|uniref:Uncharacterized protein n=1 Tax=Chaenocephalus aceratus TaxID=36190 RepID=A0ACB9WSB9_CHAAC|nr:hypothetical protein KUCAC02_009045 [Chaenocephalus aceratus]